MLCFSGSTLHGGDAVLRGKRYIIAAFLAVLAVPAKKRNIVGEDIGSAKRVKSGGNIMLTSMAAAAEESDKGFTFDFSF
ncbi:hypothetical protein EON65_32830 [archaeon]|nr:MAG: hypothetical protein EON65_32830 [archaeon]